MNKNITRLWFTGAFCMMQALSALGGTTEDFQFFQEEAKVVIATQREQRAEEAPSIVSVVTREEIERYGARDLSDILRHVPGFEFGGDVFGISGLEFRGIWVQEGKSLLMINGITQNELGYGNANFFGTLPASMIEKVEIIRGPGSAIYGGFAELDVINVITHQAANLNGLRVSGDVGVVGNGGFSRYGNVSAGSQTDALKVAAHVGYGSTVLSRRDYADFFGNRLELNSETAFREWQHIITEASAKNLTVRYDRTSIHWGGQDAFAMIQPPVNGIEVEQLNNYNDVTHLDYQAKISDHLTLQPLFEYTRNNTWSFDFPSAIIGNYQGSGVTLWRYRGEMSLNYDGPGSAQIRVGGGHLRDEVENVGADGTPGLQLSSDPTDLASRTHTSSTFGLFQYVQQIQAVGVTVGGRYEDTSFGRAFAPRAGLTYVHEAFNAKLLYGRAFRIPLPWQAYSRSAAFAGNLKPETANTSEMELGYKFTPHTKGKINLFFIDINDPIVFQGNNNVYVNFGRIQSEGAEAEFRTDYVRAGGFANVSYARPGSATSAGFVTPSNKQFLASPPVKVNVGTYVRSGIFEVAPSLTYLSPRAGQSSDSANSGILGTTRYPALFLANLNIIARSVAKDLDVHLSIDNIFDTRYILIQPYYGAHAPMPAQDRQITLGVTWHL